MEVTPFNPIFCFHCRSPNEGGEPQVSPRALIQGCRFQTALLREQFTTVLSTPKLNAHLSRLSGGLLLAPRGPCASQRKGWRCPRPPDVRMEIVCGQEGLGGSPSLGALCCPFSVSQGGRRTWDWHAVPLVLSPVLLHCTPPPTSNAVPCSITTPLCNRNTHSPDSCSFIINRALRWAMTYIVFNMEIQECLSF